MKTKSYLNLLLTLIVVSTLMFSSCKSSFPTAGTIVDCNGQLLKPILNPTKRASFPGGQEAMFKFLSENIIIPQETTIKGKVRVAFMITKKGEICDLRITSKPKEYIDNEVSRVIKMMPKWIPGINEGEIVDSYYLIDIKF